MKGQFRGKNLYGDLPQGPGLSQWDFVLRAADSALWVAGVRPRGKGFNLNPGARVDTGNWLEVSRRRQGRQRARLDRGAAAGADDNPMSSAEMLRRRPRSSWVRRRR